MEFVISQSIQLSPRPLRPLYLALVMYVGMLHVLYVYSNSESVQGNLTTLR